MSYKHTNAAVASTPLHHCNKPNTILRYLYLKANWAKKVVTQQQERLHHCVTYVHKLHTMCQLLYSDTEQVHIISIQNGGVRH